VSIDTPFMPGHRTGMIRLSRMVVSLAMALLSWVPHVFSAEPATSNTARDAVLHVNPGQAGKLIADKKVVVLDIRMPAEYAGGHIAGAKNLDFYGPDFEKQLGTMDRNQPVLVHCASGGRSTQSLAVFQKLGFKTVYHLDGGIKAWKNEGLPVEK